MSALVRGFLLAIAIATVTPAAGEMISYEICALDASGRRTIASATKDYLPQETVLSEPSGPGRAFLSKELVLGGGFAVGLDDYREPGVSGIGFWMHRVPSPMETDPYVGFSWEWFDRSNGPIFEKRKGSGRIRVASERVKGVETIVRVEFLDDIVFQMNRHRKHEPGEYSHEMLIRKGSALAFPTGT